MGAARGTRTLAIHITNTEFCRPSYRGIGKAGHKGVARPGDFSPSAKNGAAWRIRTSDPRITNAMLYQLS